MRLAIGTALMAVLSNTRTICSGLNRRPHSSHKVTLWQTEFVAVLVDLPPVILATLRGLSRFSNSKTALASFLLLMFLASCALPGAGAPSAKRQGQARNCRP